MDKASRSHCGGSALTGTLALPFSLSTADIGERAQALHLLETLRTDPEAFHRHMAKYIYPSIGGRDHERLLYYFTLLDSCGCTDQGDSALKPETHVRLLKKLKVVAAGRLLMFLLECTPFSSIWRSQSCPQLADAVGRTDLGPRDVELIDLAFLLLTPPAAEG